MWLWLGRLTSPIFQFHKTPLEFVAPYGLGAVTLSPAEFTFPFLAQGVTNTHTQDKVFHKAVARDDHIILSILKASLSDFYHNF